MTLIERLERRQPNPNIRPIVERRQPEWRRRSQEQVERVGYVAVTDLTRSVAA